MVDDLEARLARGHHQVSREYQRHRSSGSVPSIIGMGAVTS